MSAGPVLDLWLANERIDRELGEQRLRRLAMTARGVRRASLRASIGRRLIQIGERLLDDASCDLDSAVPLSTSPT